LPSGRRIGRFFRINKKGGRCSIATSPVARRVQKGTITEPTQEEKEKENEACRARRRQTVKPSFAQGQTRLDERGEAGSPEEGGGSFFLLSGEKKKPAVFPVYQVDSGKDRDPIEGQKQVRGGQTEEGKIISLGVLGGKEKTVSGRVKRIQGYEKKKRKGGGVITPKNCGQQWEMTTQKKGRKETIVSKGVTGGASNGSTKNTRKGKKKAAS